MFLMAIVHGESESNIISCAGDEANACSVCPGEEVEPLRGALQRGGHSWPGPGVFSTDDMNSAI